MQNPQIRVLAYLPATLLHPHYPCIQFLNFPFVELGHFPPFLLILVPVLGPLLLVPLQQLFQALYFLIAGLDRISHLLIQFLQLLYRRRVISIPIPLPLYLHLQPSNALYLLLEGLLIGRSLRALGLEVLG